MSALGAILVVIGIGVVVILSYRCGYSMGYAAKERKIWDEDEKSIREYRSQSRPEER